MGVNRIVMERYLGKGLSVFLILSLLAVIPFTGSVAVLGQNISLHIADSNAALIFIAAVWFLTGVLKIIDDGEGGNGLVRNIGFELSAVVSLLAVVIIAGSLSVSDIVNDQGHLVWNWFFVQNPISFFILLAVLLNRVSIKDEKLTVVQNILFMVMGLVLAAVFFGGYEFPLVSAQTIRENTFLIVNVEWPIFGIMVLVSGGYILRSNKIKKWMGYLIGVPVMIAGVAIIAAFSFFAFCPLPEWADWALLITLQISMLFGKAFIIFGLIMWVRKKNLGQKYFNEINKYVLPVAYLNIIAISIVVYLLRS